jgi:hypothetical protein
MDTNSATDRNGQSGPLPQPVRLTSAETKQVAAGIAFRWGNPEPVPWLPWREPNPVPWLTLA